MKDSVLLSIVIPVYNAAAHLESCVNSILSQTFRDFELILVDDGSSDESGSLCDKFAADGKVQVIHQKNSGPAAARNRGIEAANGKYIGFVDADDTACPDMFETLFTAAEKNDSDLAFCDYIIMKKDGNITARADLNGDKVYDRAEIEKSMLPFFFGYSDSEICRYKDFCPFADYSSYVWLCLYRSSVIKKYGLYFPDQGKYYNEDHLFNLGFVFRAKNIVHVAKPLYHYRDDGDSLTKRYNPEFLDAKIRRYGYLKDFIKRQNLGAQYLRRLENKICVESINIINYYVNAPIRSGEKYKMVVKTLRAPIIAAALKKLNTAALSFSKLSVFLRFEKRNAFRTVFLLSNAYKLVRR